MRRPTTPLYSASGLPVFQNCTYATQTEARGCPTGDMTLVQSQDTGLIYNETFDPALVTYGPDYQNEQALSGVFQKHLQSVSTVVDRHLRGRSLIEVGCGKGYFLEVLLAHGFDIIGMDPAYEGTNPRVVRQPFQPGSGYHADGIILRHVLEHVRDPVSFLQAIRDANGGGTIYIEVPCFDWICEHRVWFDVFYEHVNYFRLADLQRMFGTVFEAGRLFGEQYLYVVADLGSLRTPVADPSSAAAFPADFLASVNKQAAAVKAGAGRGTAIWGGASKGVIFALMMERAGVQVDLAVDINPAKQGRYLPVTGVKVHAPDDAMKALPATSNIFVMNGNYLGEIRAATQDRYAYITVDA